MSTNDVPGTNPDNLDELRAGCWAEHDDGSLIYVKGTEGNKVVYEIYDLAIDPPQSYTDAMPEKAFKKAFSYAPVGKSTEKWTWHDKTPFPWEKVMQRASRPKPGYATVEDQMSAAARVAESLHLRGRQIHEESVRYQTDEPGRRGRAIADKISRAIAELLS